MLDSRAYRLLTVVSDHLVLNLLWLAGCVPVVTAPVATAALFEVVRLRHTGAATAGAATAGATTAGATTAGARAFVAAFRQYFWRALAVGAAWTGIGLVLGADLVLARWMTGRPATALFVVFSALAAVYALASTSLFPTLVAFETRPAVVVRNAVLLALVFPARSVGGLLVLGVAAAAVASAPVTVLFAGSVAATLVYRLYHGAFTRLRGVAGAGQGEP